VKLHKQGHTCTHKSIAKKKEKKGGTLKVNKKTYKGRQLENEA